MGRASVQIVHDLKNQLNGLKLYATFLRKRMEKNQGPADEAETVAKLIAGLERAAADMTVLVRYGRKLEIRSPARANLIRILQVAFKDTTLKYAEAEEQFVGPFDPEALAEAFRAIADSSHRPHEIRLRIVADAMSGGESVVIEWEAGSVSDEDPFQSFAGSNGLRLALAAKIFRAHGGQAARSDDSQSTLQVRLPLREAEER